MLFIQMVPPKKLKATKENQIRLQETTKIIFPGEPGTSDLSKIKKLWNSKNLRHSECNFKI